MFNLLRQKAIFARFRSSPLEFSDQLLLLTVRSLFLPGLLKLSAKPFDQDLTMTIVLDECEKMRYDSLKRIHRTDIIHRQSRDDIGEDVEQSKTPLT